MRDIYAPKKPKKSNNLPLTNLIKYFILILALIIIVYFGFKIFNAQIDKWLELEPIDLKKIQKNVENSPKVKSTSTTNSNSSTSQSNQNSNQATTKVETTLPSIKSEVLKPNPPATDVSSDKSDTINKSDIKIRVLNGNGHAGTARQAKNILEKNGFIVASVGNANNQTYSRTVIYYNDNKEQQAEMVQSVLKENDYSTITQKNVSLTGQNDLLVVIGHT